MMSIDNFTSYLGERVNFFLPVQQEQSLYDELYAHIDGLVTSVTFDLDPRKTRFVLDGEAEFYFSDCHSINIKR